MNKDLNSLADLEDFADSLDFKDNLLDIRPFKEGHYFEKITDGYILKINIPVVEDVEVYKKGSDINIKLKDIKRIISLPNVCINSELSKYFCKGDELFIYLETKDQEELSVWELL